MQVRQNLQFRLHFAKTCAAIALGLAGATESAAQTPVDIIAVQIRSQGFGCEKPSTATRDPSLSRPGEPVWILQCESGRYRVRLVPDQAAKVERLD